MQLNNGDRVKHWCHPIYDQKWLPYADEDGFIFGKIESEPFKCCVDAFLWYFVFQDKTGVDVRWLLGDSQPSEGKTTYKKVETIKNYKYGAVEL